MKQPKNYLNDMEEELELEEKESSEKMIKAVQSMANFIISQEQLSNKGNKLGHFKSSRFLKTYIDVDEKAIIGMVEIRRKRKPEHINKGLVCLRQAVVEDGILYLVIDDEEVYRVRYLKEPEMIAYLINEQRSKAKRSTQYEK